MRWPDFRLDEGRVQAEVTALQPFDLGATLRIIYRMYAAGQGKPRWGDKTPGYVLHMRLIHSLLPEAHFAHILRDGRDVALSFQALRKPIGGPAIAEAARSIEKAAHLWTSRILAGRQQAAYLPHYLEVKFEDLVLDTEATQRRICEFVGLAWSPEMLAYHRTAHDRLSELDRDIVYGARLARHGVDRRAQHSLTEHPPDASRVYHWRADMPRLQRWRFERVAGKLLRELDYPRK